MSMAPSSQSTAVTVLEGIDLWSIHQRHQELDIATKELTSNLAQLQSREQSLKTFHIFQNQHLKLVMNSLLDVSQFITGIHRLTGQSTTDRPTSTNFTDAMDRPEIQDLPSLTGAIEALKSAERRAKEHKGAVSAQGQECANSFSKASQNKSNVEDLTRLISSCDAIMKTEISSTQQQLKTCGQQLVTNRVYLRHAENCESESRDKEELWETVHCWLKPFVVAYPFTKLAVKHYEQKTEDLSQASTTARDIVEDKKQDETMSKSRLLALRISAQLAKQMSVSNNNLYNESDRMISESKVLAEEAGNMCNEARDILKSVGEINDQIATLFMNTRPHDLHQKQGAIKQAISAISMILASDLSSGKKASVMIIDREDNADLDCNANAFNFAQEAWGEL